jgi:hypothetical protein
MFSPGGGSDLVDVLTWCMVWPGGMYDKVDGLTLGMVRSGVWCKLEYRLTVWMIWPTGIRLSDLHDDLADELTSHTVNDRTYWIVWPGEWSNLADYLTLGAVLRIRDSVLFYSLDPGSGMDFFRIPYLGSRIFWTMTKTKTLLLKP